MENINVFKLLEKLEVLLHDNPNISHVEVALLIEELNNSFEQVYKQGFIEGHGKGLDVKLTTLNNQ